MSNIDMNKNSENGSSNYTGDDKFVIKNLNLHYGDFHALKNINMNIPKNQITAFIGPSGCGKSTFLKTLNRMNDLIEGVKIDGEVYLDGANIFTEMDDLEEEEQKKDERRSDYYGKSILKSSIWLVSAHRTDTGFLL